MSTSSLSSVARFLRGALPPAVAIVAGMSVLLDRFLVNATWQRWTSTLVNWAIVLASVALLLGLANLARRHARSVVTPRDDRHRLYSLGLLAILVVTLLAGLIQPVDTGDSLASWLFVSVQMPLQASLFALLAFYMLSAAFRALRPGGLFGWGGWLFALAVVLILLSQLSAQTGRLLQPVQQWLVDVPTLAAVRGVLLGVALGASAMALRVLLGLSRPYAQRWPGAQLGGSGDEPTGPEGEPGEGSEP